jgi:hypothetical protein
MAALIARSPLGVSSMACVVDRALSRSREVAISGTVDDARTRALLHAVHASWMPDAVLAWGDPEGVELLADRPAVDGAPAAYVCENFVCMLPVTEPARLAAQLSRTAS